MWSLQNLKKLHQGLVSPIEIEERQVGALVVWLLVLDAYERRDLLHAEHLENEEKAVRVDEELREVVELHDVWERPNQSRQLEHSRLGDAREVLNHLRVRMRIAETALDVISRCRRMSMSSRLRSGGGSASDWL